MSRNLKVLGTALGAVFALTAVMATAATAAPKLTPNPSEYPVTMKGVNTGVNELAFGTKSVTCAEITYTGEAKSKAEAETGSSEVTPEYKNCTATILGSKTPSTVTVNGCKLKLNLTAFVSATEANGNGQIVCPAGKTIEIHVWETKALHEANGATICTYHIAPQVAVGNVNFKLSGSEPTPHTFLTVNGEPTLSVVKTSGTLATCGAANQTGVLKASAKVEAFNSKGEMVQGTFEE